MNRLTQLMYHGASLARLPALYRVATGGAVVFTFHNVSNQAPADPPGAWQLHLPVAEFARYLDWIASEFRVVPLDELAALAAANRSVRGLAALTFDDAYVGVLRNAIPLMRGRGLPFAVFVVAEASTRPQPFWWDVLAVAGAAAGEARDAALTRLQGDYRRILPEAGPAAWQAPPELLPADWSALRALAGADLLFGAHTVHHRHLMTLPDDELRFELTASRDLMAEQLGARPATLAYPYGIVDERVIGAARGAGYDAAFTLHYGLVQPGQDPLALPRITVPAGIGRRKLDCWAGGLRWPGSR